MTATALVPADWSATGFYFQYPVAVRAKDGVLSVAKPIRRDLSQSGLRGVWYFALDDVSVLIYLKQSCGPSRHRWIETAHCYLTPDKCEKIAAVVEEVWKRGGDVEDVIRAIETASPP
jgi:hypothetical protein